MDCSDAKHLIHLDVGDDLRTEEELPLAEHMGKCGDCRTYHAGMASTMNVLGLLRGATPEEAESAAAFRSVWPNISREINRRRTVPAKAQKFNLQVAALSVCSLSLAVVTIVQSLSSMRGSIDQGGMISAQPVANATGLQPPKFRPYLPPFQSGASSAPMPGFSPVGTSPPQSF